jgi:hypothetical protein
MGTTTETLSRDSGPSSALGVLALVGSFGLAYGIDLVIRQLRLQAGATFRFEPYILISALLPFLVVFMILGLASLLLQSLPPNRALALTYLLSGLAVPILYISFLVPYPVWLRATFLYRFQHAVASFSSQSAIYYVAAAWFVIGLLALRRSMRLGAA